MHADTIAYNALEVLYWVRKDLKRQDSGATSTPETAVLYDVRTHAERILALIKPYRTDGDER